MRERVIRVKGKGHVSVPPDCIQINLGLSVMHKEYREAMRLAGQSLEDIRQALARVELTREDIRTTRFNVSTKYTEERYSPRIFEGYVIINELKIEIPQDSKLLGRVLSAIANCPANPELSIWYKVKDEAAIKEQLLRSAVQDAKAKAAVLADSAGITLGQMLSVEYNWGEVHIRHTVYGMGAMVREGPMVDLEPDTVDADDTVTVVWAIG
jgi:uncharacterized protein